MDKPLLPYCIVLGLRGHCVALDGADAGKRYDFEVGLDEDGDGELWIYLSTRTPEGSRQSAFDCNPQYFGAHFRWERHGREIT